MRRKKLLLPPWGFCFLAPSICLIWWQSLANNLILLSTLRLLLNKVPPFLATSVLFIPVPFPPFTHVAPLMPPSRNSALLLPHADTTGWEGIHQHDAPTHIIHHWDHHTLLKFPECQEN